MRPNGTKLNTKRTTFQSTPFVFGANPLSSEMPRNVASPIQKTATFVPRLRNMYHASVYHPIRKKPLRVKFSHATMPNVWKRIAKGTTLYAKTSVFVLDANTW